MGFVWVSQFVCRECGAAEPSTQIDYDSLGYAVCPTCGSRTGPRTAPEATVGR